MCIRAHNVLNCFVSRQLGHTSSQITLGVYAHLLDRDEQSRRTREMLQDMLGDMV
jgi:integrase